MIDNAELGYTPSNLKQIRKNHGLTQTALGELVGVTQRTVARWEMDLSKDNRLDMSYTKWAELLKNLQKTEKNACNRT